jgi:hypothetical protein
MHWYDLCIQHGHPRALQPFNQRCWTADEADLDALDTLTLSCILTNAFFKSVLPIMRKTTRRRLTAYTDVAASGLPGCGLADVAPNHFDHL